MIRVKYLRRKYRDGQCGLCGNRTAVTPVTFWVNGLGMSVCKECRWEIAGRILRPCIQVGVRHG